MGEVVIIIDETKSSKLRISRCRICHEEEAESFFEVPCACSGTVKFAHRDCIQRWCNEKGNTTCEICLQVLYFLTTLQLSFFAIFTYFVIIFTSFYEKKSLIFFCEDMFSILWSALRCFVSKYYLFSWIVYCVSVSSVFVFGRQVVS